MKKNRLQVDFENFLKKLPQKTFVRTTANNGDILYSFAYGHNIYVAKYSNHEITIKDMNHEEFLGDRDFYAMVRTHFSDEWARTVFGAKNLYFVDVDTRGIEILIEDTEMK